MLTKENLNEALADAVMDRPREFYIGEKRFCLWSPSLGMTMMLERHIAELGIDHGMIARNPSVEALRLTVDNRDEVCNILSISSFRRFSELSDVRKLQERSRYFSEHLSDEELAEILLLILSEPRIETILSVSGIAADQREQSMIAHIKNKGGHSRSFGGKTIYGLLIDAACRAYGWTKQYVVWGIDLVSLRMMLADSINSIYLSDEEAKQLGIQDQGAARIGMSADDFAKLREEFKD